MNIFQHFFKKCALGAFLLFLTLHASFAQTRPANENQVKAAFIYNFTRFIDWPPAAFSSANAPFVIGILGDDPVGGYLEILIKDERLDNRLITVQRFSGPDEIDHCNILIISVKEALKIKNLIPSINRRGILTVSDGSGFAKWGGVVGFFKEENKFRLQINIAEAKAAQLTISSKLLSLSSIYRAD